MLAQPHERHDPGNLVQRNCNNGLHTAGDHVNSISANLAISSHAMPFCNFFGRRQRQEEEDAATTPSISSSSFLSSATTREWPELVAPFLMIEVSWPCCQLNKCMGPLTSSIKISS